MLKSAILRVLKHKLFYPCAAVGLLFVLSLWLASGSPSYETCQRDAEANNYPDDSGLFDGVISFFRCDAFAISENGEFVTALATIALVFSTIFLWIATRNAANAAKEAADALPIVERAYLYPAISFQGDFNKTITAARVFYSDQEDGAPDIPYPVTERLTFSVRNFGKTPAIVYKVEAGIGTTDRDFPLQLSPVSDAFLGSRESISPGFLCESAEGLSRRQSELIFRNRSHLCFRGCITFDDIWEIRWVVNFQYLWLSTRNRWVIHYLRTAKELRQDDDLLG